MAYPNAQLYLMEKEEIREYNFQETMHFQISKKILSNPVAFMKNFFGE